MNALSEKSNKENRFQNSVDCIVEFLQSLPLDEKVKSLNYVRLKLHETSPFKMEPVDCVEWVKCDDVYANDYNPNSVAPPEMELLAHSIMKDGYTQPIVTYPTETGRQVVDGFHRNRVGKENKLVNHRIKGYLPVVAIRADQEGLNDRIASTIRHNRARGKHRVDAMSDIVVELRRRNWTNEKIATELGMDQDEILRLCQITGLAELFKDQQFSASWDVEGQVTESDFEELTDEYYEDDTFRKAPTGGEDRIFHTYDKWECYKAGFYATSKEGMSKARCEELYREFLSDSERFEGALQYITENWKNSCEHYLTNNSMNRIAWLGQASACHAINIPAIYRSGFFLLTPEQQDTANKLALRYLNKWLEAHGRNSVTMEQAYSGQSDLY